MQLSKLLGLDEYQLQNLGNFERLFPPMNMYHETFIPEDVAKIQPPTDPLALKLWHLDRQMAKKKDDSGRHKKEESRQIQGIPGNSIDEKLLAYHQNFLTVVKSFVSNMQVSKISK